jgi:hypothetical protein
MRDVEPQESFADRVRRKPVAHTLEHGDLAIFSNGKCTLIIGDQFIDIPNDRFVSIARVLSIAHELLHRAPEAEKGRSR